MEVINIEVIEGRFEKVVFFDLVTSDGVKPLQSSIEVLGSRHPSASRRTGADSRLVFVDRVTADRILANVRDLLGRCKYSENALQRPVCCG